jgi:hypothetical protein
MPGFLAVGSCFCWWSLAWELIWLWIDWLSAFVAVLGRLASGTGADLRGRPTGVRRPITTHAVPRLKAWKLSGIEPADVRDLFGQTRRDDCSTRRSRLRPGAGVGQGRRAGARPEAGGLSELADGSTSSQLAGCASPDQDPLPSLRVGSYRDFGCSCQSATDVGPARELELEGIPSGVERKKGRQHPHERNHKCDQDQHPPRKIRPLPPNHRKNDDDRCGVKGSAVWPSLKRLASCIFLISLVCKSPEAKE